MEVKEKAKELVEKYNDYTKAEYVIQLTLTVVEEKIELLSDINLNIDCGLYVSNYLNNEIEKLEEVKQEINKL